MRSKSRRTEVTYSRVDLSHYHLYSAFFFADWAAQLETKASTMASSASVYEYRSFVMGAVMSAVAFVEARLAELLVDAADGPFCNSTIGLTPEQCRRLSGLMGSRGPLLDKYQTVLRILEKPLLNTDSDPYRSAALVVRLRNFLVHYSGEWAPIPDEESEPVPDGELHVLERRLKGHFGSTAFAEPDAPFFPDHCLSAAAATWAAQSMLAFSDRVSERGSLLRKHLRPIISTALQGSRD
jgi:hypothetical protein